MKKTKFFFAFCSLALLLTACGSKNAQITITEDDAEYVVDVYGGKDFMEAVPGIYDVDVTKGKLSVTIPLKIINDKRQPNYIVDELSLYPTDTAGHEIWADGDKVEFQASDKEAAYKKLCAAAVGEVVKVTFQYLPSNKNAANDILDAIVSCNIDLSIDEPEEEEDYKPVYKNTSSTDWNKILDSYEKYVDQYIAVMKKVQGGDLSAYGDLASLMEEYEKLANQLEGSMDDLTPAQAARFTKITNKLATAAF